MKYYFCLFLSFQAFSQSDFSEKVERARILNEYGSRDKLEEVEGSEEGKRSLTRVIFQINEAKKKIQEPLVESQGAFDKLGSDEKLQYIEDRRIARHKYTRFISKAIKLAENYMSEEDMDTFKVQVLRGLDDETITKLDFKFAKKPLPKVSKALKTKSLNQVTSLSKAMFKEANGKEKAEGQEDTSSFSVEESSKVDASIVSSSQVSESFLMKMMNKEMKDKVQSMIKSNPLAHMSKQQLQGLLLGREGLPPTSMGKIFKANPRVLELVVEVLHDEHALPRFLSLMNKPKKMKTYGISVIVFMIFIFFINLKNSAKKIFKRIMFKFILMGASTLGNFLIFYIIFREELGPTVEIIKRVW